MQEPAIGNHNKYYRGSVTEINSSVKCIHVNNMRRRGKSIKFRIQTQFYIRLTTHTRPNCTYRIIFKDYSPHEDDVYGVANSRLSIEMCDLVDVSI